MRSVIASVANPKPGRIITGPALSPGDQRILDELMKLPSKAVARCADRLLDEHTSLHRGAMFLSGCKLVFGNDGFRTGDEASRAQREVIAVTRTIARINRIWKAPIFKFRGFGVSACGYTWAMRVETGYFAWDDVLNTAVWDAWFRVCGGSQHPWPNRLNKEIRQMFYVPDAAK